MRSKEDLISRLSAAQDNLKMIKTVQQYNSGSLVRRVTQSSFNYDYAWTVASSAYSSRRLQIRNTHSNYNMTEVQICNRINNPDVMASATYENDGIAGPLSATIRGYRLPPFHGGQDIIMTLYTRAPSYPITVYVKFIVIGTDDVTFTVV